MARSNKGGSNKGRGGPSPKRQPAADKRRSGGPGDTKNRGPRPRGVYDTKDQAVREARRRGGEVVEHRQSGKVVVRRPDAPAQPERTSRRSAADAPSRPRPTTHVTPAPGGGWRVESRPQPSAAREGLHRLIDELPARELGEVASFLEYLRWRAGAGRGFVDEVRRPGSNPQVTRPVVGNPSHGGAPRVSPVSPTAREELRKVLGARAVVPAEQPGEPWLAYFDHSDEPVVIDPTLQTLYSAPPDDEPITDAEEAAVAEGRRDVEAGAVEP